VILAVLTTHRCCSTRETNMMLRMQMQRSVTSHVAIVRIARLEGRRTLRLPYIVRPGDAGLRADWVGLQGGRRICSSSTHCSDEQDCNQRTCSAPMLPLNTRPAKGSLRPHQGVAPPQNCQRWAAA